jgi:hypothetical protein
MRNNEAVRILESARMYLAKLPIEDQFMIVDETGWLVNPAIPILFEIEAGLKFYEGAR